MGRSRAALRQAEDDPNLRSKRKKAALNVENLETSSTGLGVNEGKISLYHCNYCNKDISERIRIKCVVCQDFDLCIECFSVGAEVTPHKCNHPYRVMHSSNWDKDSRGRDESTWEEIETCPPSQTTTRDYIPPSELQRKTRFSISPPNCPDHQSTSYSYHDRAIGCRTRHHCLDWKPGSNKKRPRSLELLSNHNTTTGIHS
ncbi:transcriptional adapter ADA2 [Senna tora]|uniref:Transcriptional adapter ADA2 n=1 Tax=Senna tora TaxID=362788 RepID=A0A834T4U3_9FABA|nr:transcriptional adapter ADA2 [Senna tora]